MKEYIEAMNSVASDGTPLSEHFLVFIFKHIDKIRVHDISTLKLLDDLIQKLAELSFTDKNPLNHNIYILHQERLICAQKLF